MWSALLLVAGCIAVAVRQRLASGWVWVGLILISLLTGILGFHLRVVPSQGSQRAETIYSLFALAYVDGRESLPATLAAWALHTAILLAIAAAAYHILRVRLASQPRLAAVADSP